MFWFKRLRSLKKWVLNRKRAKTIMIFGISAFNYLLSAAFQLKSEGTVGGLPSKDENIELVRQVITNDPHSIL